MIVDKKNDGYQLFLTSEEYDAILCIVGNTTSGTYLEAIWADWLEDIFPIKCNTKTDIYTLYENLINAR
jgi:hypothetical protein